MSKPVVAALAKPAPQPIAIPAGENLKSRDPWTFSFEHWRQIEYFGLSHVSASWFIDLLNGLKDTGAHLEKLIDGDPGARKAFHFHEVIWTNAKVNIRRKDLDWLPQEIRENPEDFPMHQLSLVKGHFRLVGYWIDESRVFYVVLIDPHHNIHKSSGYESGQHCEEQLGVHHQLISALEDLTARAKLDPGCIAANCEMHGHLAAARNAYTLKGQIYIDPDIIDLAIGLIQNGKAENLSDVFMTGVMAHGEK